MKKYPLVFMLLFISLFGFCQSSKFNFKIRTITAGITLANLADTITVLEAVNFLKQARDKYVKLGYEVQTIRIVTQNLHEYLGERTYEEAIPSLIKFDRIAQREDIPLAIGEILPSNRYDTGIAVWAVKLIEKTEMINFSLPISSQTQGLLPNSIKAAAEITVAISKNSKGGEGNFRFTASANCPAGIPFFPAAYHKGRNSFAIGLESPPILKEVFEHSDWSNAKQNLKSELENQLKPVESVADWISKLTGWQYDGIDTSPAPGLDASIGEAIEALTNQPFGEPSTLRACALITETIKNLSLKTCGYSGLMLPVIEDKTLAQRAMEHHYTVKELLLFSSVSGTGLDVIPLPGNTSLNTIENIYFDVAALSLKYTNKALSARLFLIPGKGVGDLVEFENPHLTKAVVMSVE